MLDPQELWENGSKKLCTKELLGTNAKWILTMQWNMPEAKVPNVLSLLDSVGELGLFSMPANLVNSSEVQVSIQVSMQSAIHSKLNKKFQIQRPKIQILHLDFSQSSLQNPSMPQMDYVRFCFVQQVLTQIFIVL